MSKLFIATHNKHKVDEFRVMLGKLPFEIEPLPDGLEDSPETGDSFEMNALQKAMYYGRFCNGIVLADDSGLSVPELGGEPGIFSARYAGEHGDDAANREKLLFNMKHLDTDDLRRASFSCSIAVWDTEHTQGLVVSGHVDGVILREERGTGGFGYDSLFYVPSQGCTFAEMLPSVKNQYSHRAKAVASLMDVFAGGVFHAALRGER